MAVSRASTPPPATRPQPASTAPPAATPTPTPNTAVQRRASTPSPASPPPTSRPATTPPPTTRHATTHPRANDPLADLDRRALDALAHRLIEPVGRLLRAELRLGRERAGRWHDGAR
ncbi:hypothetical protein GCM10010123_44980 [Pilimelia anulata]|uniref:Uncharacterized protein n=1 Tax=Pilimelia anulata TaxID=53371 RepID=A0A8J3BGU7_9ACTN|nr:hypothetical protein GCM10010123_44980 [Pilimelia anulata]